MSWIKLHWLLIINLLWILHWYLLFNVTSFLIIYAIFFSNVHPVNVSPTELAWLKLFLVAAPNIMFSSGSRARFTYLVPIGPRKISPSPPHHVNAFKKLYKTALLCIIVFPSLNKNEFINDYGTFLHFRFNIFSNFVCHNWGRTSDSLLA